MFFEILKKFINGIFLFLTSLGYSQSLYKETTKINDSVDYFLEVAVFNKDDKKSFNKAIIYTEKAIEYAKENNLNEKLADCYLVLGSIHFDLNKMDSAIENFIRSINYYNKKRFRCYKYNKSITYRVGKKASDKFNVI